MRPIRLDSMLVEKGLLKTRSQAAKYIALKAVKVNGKVADDPGIQVTVKDNIKLIKLKTYVSRAALKLEAANEVFKVNFADKKVLDIGSSTGGFTDYALKYGAQKVVAIELGSEQMDRSLRSNPKLALHEKTDIRQVNSYKSGRAGLRLSFVPDIVVIDLSFISLREILPHVKSLVNSNSQIFALVKPQFEAGSNAKNTGIIKNQKIRRDILKDFETWLKTHKFLILDKSDSSVSGLKGNVERFYLLKVSA